MSKPIDVRGAKRCPVCEKPADEAFRPFCSKRCSDIDLNRWLSGVYAVPATGTDEDEEGPASTDEERE
ncbi:MAG TPA: DNA gyrase inhibitor YacG [Xanthobacteraceae bacterium]|jgi:hypothetical protein|nr:DNA gyrase inhibitor YacG [Xanthobacteraceae bacterium]